MQWRSIVVAGEAVATGGFTLNNKLHTVHFQFFLTMQSII